MNLLIDKLKEFAAQRPDASALMSDAGGDVVSFSDLDDLTGRIYAGLKAANIGKEDMVLIFLPRGVQIFVSLLGVMKAGAVFTVLEDTTPVERKKYIEKDAGCRFVIDSQVYAQMLALQPLAGYEEPSPHDACYAVYTSGSTGTPKGVLHEYGQIGLYLKSEPEIKLSGKFDEAVAFVAPLNFIISISLFHTCVDKGACAVIADYSTIRDPEVFRFFLERNKITHTIVTPALLKNLKEIPACVRQLFVGGEKASELYIEGRELVNVYACSESGIDICVFTIDKPYHITPVGKNRCGTRILLLDESGNETERGEICFINPFCRGYINLPEMNRQAFRNGLYHTGDEGCFTEDGNLVVCGRIDDMIKIRGNRVEPAEIESAILQYTQAGIVVVKGFREGEKEFLVAYVKGAPEGVKADDLKKELQKTLPDYMIPVYYEFVQDFPLLPSGKIDRKALAAPVFKSFECRGVSPENEIQAYLCRLFEKELSIGKVGVNDDFFELGGDSLAVMEMITKCSLKSLSVTDIYEFRTPAGIAEHLLKQEMSEVFLEYRRIDVMCKAQPALLETEIVFDVQRYAPRSTMNNLSFLFQARKNVCPEKLAKAVDKALKHHPVFSSVFFKEKGKLFQKYRPELYENVEIIHTTEAEFAQRRKELVRCFEPLLGRLLYRKAIFVTEQRTLLFFDIHHSITDGSSLYLLMNQICTCYQNQDAVLPEDYYYLILEEFKNQVGDYRDKNNEVYRHYQTLSEQFLKGGKFFEPRIFRIPVRPDGLGRSLRRGFFKFTPDFSKTEVREFLWRNRLTENEFFATACLLAIARYNRRNKSTLLFIHSGRDNAMRASTCGLMLHTLPLFADLSKHRNLLSLLDDIRAQEEYGLSHGNFNISRFINDAYSLSLFFIFHKDLLNKNNFPIFDRRLELDSPNASDALIVFSVIDNEECADYGVEIAYSATNYREASIRKFSELFIAIVKDLLHRQDK